MYHIQHHVQEHAIAGVTNHVQEVVILIAVEVAAVHVDLIVPVNVTLLVIQAVIKAAKQVAMIPVQALVIQNV